MTGTSRISTFLLAIAGAASFAGCPSATLSLNPDLAALARLDSAPTLKAAAYLIGEGHLRVNIEPDPDHAGSCGLSVFIKANAPGAATLEVRCPAAEKKLLQKDGGGAMGSIFEKTGFSVVSFKCIFAPEMLDFAIGDETRNAGCFQSETTEKKPLKGCFTSKGLAPIEEPKHLKPIVN